MNRILGLDYGDKAIGVSISDPLGLTAQPLETIVSKDEYTIKPSVSRLKEIIKEYDVSTIILGLPKNMDNTLGPRAEKTIDFMERLKRNFKKVEITLWDERLSTMAIERALGELKQKDQRYDHLAATYILQGYLDRMNRS